MQKIIIALLSIFILTSVASSASAEKNEAKYRRYSRVNSFLNTKFPMSKAAPDYYRR